jgi:hypothetical protein
MPRLKSIVTTDYAVRAVISPDGRTIAFPGTYRVYFIDAINLHLVSSINCPKAYYLKMTNNHVFVKHA